jgi:hypothetical protein
MLNQNLRYIKVLLYMANVCHATLGYLHCSFDQHCYLSSKFEAIYMVITAIILLSINYRSLSLVLSLL